MTDDQRIEAEGLVRRMIELIGDDPDREGLLSTPERVVRSWSELYSGYCDDCKSYTRLFEVGYDQVVVLRNIGFHSMCEHHMLPFFGNAHIAYIPQDKKVIGVSKLARIVNAKARRLQIQERMTSEIADAIHGACSPKGIAVVVEAQHLCMVSRGTKQHSSQMKTSRVVGVFRDNPAARAEAFSLLRE